MKRSKLLVRQQTRPLHGRITVPGDKSISHRAVILLSLADGRSTVRNWLPAGDTLATLDAMRALHVNISEVQTSPQAWELTIEGQGLEGLQEPARPLNCANAGTCMRLLAGIMVGQRYASVLDGSGQLRRRPMRRIIDPLRRMGANIDGDEGHAPLRITPSSLEGITYAMKVASAQVKSAILLAGLYADGATRVIEPGPARDHTERMMKAMGVNINVEANCVELSPAQRISPLDITVPGDLSSAAFPIVAAGLVAGSEITVPGLGHNNTRTGMLDVLEQMGATFVIANRRLSGGEERCDLTVGCDRLRGQQVGGGTVVRAIDEFPVLMVAATQAEGDTIVRDAAELRVKEVDRISVLASELGKMGGHIIEHADGFAASGRAQLQGAEVDSHGDHRIGMALAVAGLMASGQTVVHNADCIDDSFPGFVESMRAVGAEMEWEAT